MKFIDEQKRGNEACKGVDSEDFSEKYLKDSEKDLRYFSTKDLKDFWEHAEKQYFREQLVEQANSLVEHARNRLHLPLWIIKKQMADPTVTPLDRKKTHIVY